ncbi:MAG: CocE/NonD family hydrolase [Planctomycetota bacterium]
MPSLLELAFLGAALALAAPCATASTVTSGHVSDATSGAPATDGWVGLVRESTLTLYPPATSIWPEALAELNGSGDYSFTIDDGDPSFNEFFVYSLSIFHLNEIYDSASSTFALPFKEDFLDPQVTPLDGRQANPGIDFSLESNKHTELILMRDGITHLATDIYCASPTARAPTILSRTVYNKDGMLWGAYYTIFGYNYVAQDSRGRFASEGIDPVFRDDAWGENQDGYDTIEWIVSQPFSKAAVGMYGGSALGITQYLTAGATPPGLKCCYAVVGTGNLYDGCMYTGGIFRKHMIECWLEGQGSLHHLPDLEAHPNRDAWWDEVDIVNRLAQIRVPFFHIGGWFDIFQEGATRGFHDLQHLGGSGARGTQKLLIGPWTHSGLFAKTQGELVFPDNATWDDGFSTDLAFFDYWLKGVDNGFYDRPAVRYYVMGDVDDPAAPGNEWREVDDWPPPATGTPYYLWADRTLRTAPHPARSVRGTSQTSVSFAYDPANPVPTLGGANLCLPAGPFDQRPNEQRPDVLTFTTERLTKPLEVTGHLRAELFVASTAPDTDFMVKLCDVYPDGRSMLIQEGAMRARHWVDDRSENLLEPGRIYRVTIDVWSTSIVFNAGHSIRVSVTSSNDPRWDLNPNTGEPFRQHTHLEIATNTIYCAAPYASRIILPVVEP